MKNKIILCSLCIITLFSLCGCEKKEKSIQNNVQNNNSEQKTNPKTTKDKIKDYYIDNYDAFCTEQKCTYNFSSYFGNTKYTIDFERKVYYIETYISDGNTYEEYNYENNSAYLKNISNVGWTTTTEVKGNFNNNEFKWNCNSDLQDACETLGQDFANKLIELKSDLDKICNKLGININDI